MRNNYFIADREKEEQVLKEFIHVQNRVYSLKEWMGLDLKDRLVCEPWDWLVMLQWLQDHGLFKIIQHVRLSKLSNDGYMRTTCRKSELSALRTS